MRHFLYPTFGLPPTKLKGREKNRTIIQSMLIFRVCVKFFAIIKKNICCLEDAICEMFRKGAKFCLPSSFP